jgi:hypothetical protein
MSRRRKKTQTPSSGSSDELGDIIAEETGIPLSVLDARQKSDALQASKWQDTSVPDTRVEDDSVGGVPLSTTASAPGEVHDAGRERAHAAEAVGDTGSGIDAQGETEELLGASGSYEKEHLSRRIVPAFIGTVVLLGILGAIGFGIFISQLLDAKSQAEGARQSFAALRHSAATLDFRSAIEQFPKGHSAISKLKSRVGGLQFAAWLPWVGPSIRETYSALQILERIFVSGEQLLSHVNTIGAIIFRNDGEKTFELYMKTLTIREKGTLLRMMTEALPALNGAKASLQLAVRDIDALDKTRISSQLKEALAGARIGAVEISDSISAWLPLAEIIPTFLGYPNEKTYLILLQDTSELRATGGFISHYGILKISNGEITYLKTDNVYNLDDRGGDAVSVPPPPQIGQYFSKGIGKWYFRDANWSPDFRDAARQAQALYRLESGSPARLDGVLAATPELVRSLLRFTGPIRIEGRDYDADTFLENLAFEVREGNYRRGISEKERKEIFGELVARIADRLLDIPLTRWIDLYKIIEARLGEKHLLLYFDDEQLQAFARLRGWSGEIRSYDGDFLMVVDTTLGTLKTESVMDKEVRYTMREDPDGFLVGHVDLEYKNNGTYSDVTTRYRDWVRILVPKGSTLISSSGAQVSDDQSKQGTLEITERSGTMQFGAYITVEPRYTKIVSIEYRLPDRLYDRVRRDGVYTLLLQKQPGNTRTRFKGNMIFLTLIAEYAPLGFFNTKRSARTLDLFSDLRTDQEYTVRIEEKSEE